MVSNVRGFSLNIINFFGSADGYQEGVGAQDTTTLASFGDGTDYYLKAVALKDAAINFADGYGSTVTFTIDGSSEVDYTDNDYAIIRKYSIDYDPNVITLKENDFEAVDIEGSDIKDKVELEWEKNDAGKITFVTIKVRKADMPSSFGKITFKYYKKNDLNAKYYILEPSNSNSESVQEIIWGESNLQESSFDLTLDINKILIPAVQVKLKKVDTEGDAVCGAVFKIEYNNGLPSSERDTLSDGTRTFLKVQPTSPDSFTATITETETPAGYKPLAKPIQLKFTFNSSTVNWEVEKIDGPEETTTIGTINKNTRTNTCIVPITVVNKSIIEKLTILKTSSIKELGALEGAEFKLTLSNVANVKSYKIPTTGATQEAPKTIYVTTDSNGNIVLEDIEIADLSEYVVITIEETKAPVGYKKIKGNITLTLKRQGIEYTVQKTTIDGDVTEEEFIPGTVNVENHELTLNIHDIPVMNLGGVVWYEDEKTGKTPVSSDVYGDGER